jgi:uncharacterized protein (TIGR03437 family)
VAISGDGHTILIGGPGDTGGAGAAWAFTVPKPVVAAGGVVNGASFRPGIAPGAWITIQGTGLASTTRTWTDADFSGDALPLQLDGVSVHIGGTPAPVYFVSPTQLNVLAPAGAAGASVAVQVTTPLGTSDVVMAEGGTLSPALFAFPATRYVAAVRTDYSYAAPTNMTSGVLSRPARPGETLMLFGTGFGPTDPPSDTGRLSAVAPLAGAVTVRLGGAVAKVLYAGMVSPGLCQFNIVVPDVPEGDQAGFRPPACSLQWGSPPACPGSSRCAPERTRPSQRAAVTRRRGCGPDATRLPPFRTGWQ